MSLIPRENRLRLAVFVWLVGALLLGVTAELSFDHLWILAFFPLVIWAVLGLVLFCMVALRLRQRGQRRAAGIALVAMVGATFAFSPLASFGARLTTKARFALQRGHYEQVISTLRDTMRLKGHPAGGYHHYHGLEYIVNSGPPLRLAFPWPGGILDNWCGAVYDSTGLVMQANKFTGDWERWHEQVPIDVIRMFGGDMLYCQELESPFYECCFT